MGMRIAFVVPPDVPLAITGGEHADGIGTVVSSIMSTLARKGHDVHLFASGDSKVSHGTTLHSTVPVALRERPFRPYPNWPFVTDKTRACIARCTVQRCAAGHFDIIHAHDAWIIREGGWRLDNLVTTLHTCLYPLTVSTPDRAICLKYPDAPIVTVSRSQQRALPWRRWFGYVHNGIGVRQFTFRRKPDPDAYAFCIGRMTPTKGVSVAIKTVLALAQRGYILKLKIAGGVSLGSQEYFDTMVKPFLEEYPDLIEYVGEVGHAQKNRLYGGARFTICPLGVEAGGTEWFEPFGNVLVESLSCGTPVIVGNKASGPEIVRNGVTGRVVDPSGNEAMLVSRFADAAEDVLRSPEMRIMARSDAERRFTVERMVSEYESVYEQILERTFERMPVMEQLSAR
ncbi:MAG TPA: glycosyltransferase [Candidatus Paceibacterota bacterium]|nr:glycosyltransferase [Candidatus Paceibacterota bacterium]